MACQSCALLGHGCGSLGTFVVPADHLVFKMCSHGGHRQGGPPPTVATRARLRMRTAERRLGSGRGGGCS